MNLHKIFGRAGHCRDLLASQLGRTIDGFPPLADCIEFSGNIETRLQEGGLQIRSYLNHLGPLS